jgi:hypothetical protein
MECYANLFCTPATLGGIFTSTTSSTTTTTLMVASPGGRLRPLTT